VPARNRTKQYVEDGYYHIYNRGVEKRLIFLDAQDYSVFLVYLKDYLLPKDEEGLRKQLVGKNSSSKEKDRALKLLRLNNFADEITLLAFCLIPNHFHLFLKQKSPQSIDKFIQSLCTRYTMYFNKKHKRIGSLWQDTYKAVLLTNDEQFLYLSKYIHKQAIASQGVSLRSYMEEQPSSYSEYLKKRKTEWVHSEEILAFFSKNNSNLSYEAFVAEDDELEIFQEVDIKD
jgi:putative transposase